MRAHPGPFVAGEGTGYDDSGGNNDAGERQDVPVVSKKASATVNAQKEFNDLESDVLKKMMGIS